MLQLTVRLVCSLAVVVGLLLLLTRLGQRRFRGRAGAPVRIVHRQSLSRTSAVAVVEVGNRVLVLGTTEHQINVLAELDPEELLTGADLTGDLDEVVLELPPVLDLPRPAPVSAPARVVTPAAAPVAAPRTSDRPGSHRAAPLRTVPVADGPLAGSILSVQTWRQALAAASRRAS